MTAIQMSIIAKAKEFIKTIFKEDCTGHDVYHTQRVLRTALAIQKEEGGDEFLVSLGSLLHDVDDYKLVKVSEKDPYHNARTFMESVKLDDATIKKVIDIVKDISFKGKDTKAPSSLEGKIVQDADRIDALGAIGIARAFAYGAHKGSPLYDPNVKPVLDMDFETYKKNRGSTVNHFYEKLLLLKDLMNTKTGKRIAAKRDQYMQAFLEEFFEEWEGKE